MYGASCRVPGAMMLRRATDPPRGAQGCCCRHRCRRGRGDSAAGPRLVGESLQRALVVLTAADDGGLEVLMLIMAVMMLPTAASWQWDSHHSGSVIPSFDCQSLAGEGFQGTIRASLSTDFGGAESLVRRRHVLHHCAPILVV